MTQSGRDCSLDAARCYATNADFRGDDVASNPMTIIDWLLAAGVQIIHILALDVVRWAPLPVRERCTTL